MRVEGSWQPLWSLAACVIWVLEELHEHFLFASQSKP